MAADLNSYRSSIGQFNQNYKYERKLAKRNKKANKSSNTTELPAFIKLWFILAFFPDYPDNLYRHPVNDPDFCTQNHGFKPPSGVSRILCYLIILLNIIMLCGDVHPNPGPIQSTNNLSVFFLNAQSLKSKTISYLHMIQILQPDIIAINETWLTSGVPNSSFSDGNIYSIYRNDRGSTRGGGVLLMIKKSIWSKDRTDWLSPDPNNNEITMAEIRPSPGRKIATITAYRPQTNPCPEFLGNLDVALTNCLENNIAEFIILGDFNYSDIRWDNTLDIHLSKNSRELQTYLNQHNLIQINPHPSRRNEENILDLIITNLPEEHSEVTSGRYDFKSDHYLFDTEFKIQVNRKTTVPRSVYNYKKADFDSIKTNIQEDDSHN